MSLKPVASRLGFTRYLLVPSFVLAACSFASAQTLGDAILTLWDGSMQDGATQIVNGRFYGSTIDFRVRNNDGDNQNLGDVDRVLGFEMTGAGTPLRFPAPPGGATRDVFEDWLGEHASELVANLFPTSVSQSMSGKDIAQNHAQQFLLNDALAIDTSRQFGTSRPARAGGLFEFESLNGIGRKGMAAQGLYRLEGAHLSFLGRFARLQQAVRPGETVAVTSTRSFTFSTDFHPSMVISSAVDWRIGVSARTGLLFSQASTFNFASLDYGGGIWTSAQKDFSRVRVGLAGLLQGSNSYVPTSLAGDLDFLAVAINRKPVAWDLSYGAVAGFALSRNASLNAKLLQTRPFERFGEGFERVGDHFASTTIVMGSVSCLIGGLTPVDVGYKLSDGQGIRTHSIFVQGHFGW